MASGVTEIKGFGVLPVSLPKSSSPHYIFFKKHESKAGSNTSNRALFMVNLPIETSFSTLKKYFQKTALGATIESFIPSLLTDFPEDTYVDLTKLTSDLELSQPNEAVEIGSKLPKNCGIVNFIDKSAFQLALSSLKGLASDATVSNWPMVDLGPGFLLKSIQQHTLDPETLTKDVAQALATFNTAEKESAEKLQQQAQLVDEDGFTLVVGTHRKTKAGIMGKQKLAATVELEKAKNKMKKKEKDDFYRYQLRQRKKEEMNELLHKFKLDQERVRQMKEKKRFRPY